MYGYDDILVLRDDLLTFAWSAPMRDLAAKVGVSDVGLKKLLKSRGVVTPPQGHWNKVHAGKRVPPCPKAPARRPGESGRVRVDRRFAVLIPEAARIQSVGPFASSAVPEDLELLREQELKAIGRAGVAKGFVRTHPGIASILKCEQQREEKAAKNRWCWDLPKFSGRLDRRRLRILNAVLLVLSKRAHGGDAYDRDGVLHATAIIGDTNVGIAIDVTGSHRDARRRGSVKVAPDLPAKTCLTFYADVDASGSSSVCWSDDGDGTLETKIAVIAAGLIVAGEAKFRRGLREAEERDDQFRLWEEKRRQEELAEKNRKRLEGLHQSGELLRQAEDIRKVARRMREAMASHPELDATTIAAWEEWALGEADKLDPILSGQVRDHLEPRH